MDDGSGCGADCATTQLLDSSHSLDPRLASGGPDQTCWILSWLDHCHCWHASAPGVHMDCSSHSAVDLRFAWFTLRTSPRPAGACHDDQIQL